jgi:HSP20 family protein
MKNIHDFIDQFFNDPFLSYLEFQGFQVDIFDLGKEILIEAELPGYQPEQIHIEAIDGGIKISAEDKQEYQTLDDQNYIFKNEKKLKQVERVVPLPSNVSKTDIKTNFENGILEIFLKKITDK